MTRIGAECQSQAHEVGIGKALSNRQVDVFLFQTGQPTRPGSHSERAAKWGLRLLSPVCFLPARVTAGKLVEARHFPNGQGRV